MVPHGGPGALRGSISSPVTAAAPPPAASDVSIIAALTRDRVIGSGGELPWKLPAEYRHFLDRVRGHTVIMGRRSWEIFGPDLGCAEAVVLSRHHTEVAGAITSASLDDALATARDIGRPVFVAGGATVYEAALPQARWLELSWIHGSYDGDTYFPRFDPADWVEVTRRDHPGWTFVRSRRREPDPSGSR